MKCILICPRCKQRREVDYEEWCKGQLPGGMKFVCENILCSHTGMVYHKDGA